MSLLDYIYVTSVLIAFLSSLISFRLDFPSNLKLFSCLLGLTFLVELTASILLVLHIRNFWLYNLFMLVEFSCYGYYYLQFIKISLLQRVLKTFLVIFPTFWAVTIFFVFKLTIWNSYVIVFGSFFTVLFSFMYYYQLITSPEIQPLRKLPEFWIATGMLTFYLGALPFYGMLNFLIHSHRTVAITLADVLEIMNIIMYGLFSYAFICRIINIKKS